MVSLDLYTAIFFKKFYKAALLIKIVIEFFSKFSGRVRPVLSGHSEKDQKWVFKTNYSLMQVKSIREHSAILLTCIQLPSGFKTFVLSIFEWPLKTGFTVQSINLDSQTERIIWASSPENLTLLHVNNNETDQPAHPQCNQHHSYSLTRK